MTMAYWHSEYCTGNSLIDQQHQNLFVVINSLYNAMMQGHGKNQIKQTLRELLNGELLQFLNEWLIHHIKGEDLKMINFMRHKNQLQYKKLKI